MKASSEEYLQESLVYERAWSRLSVILNQIGQERKADIAEKRKQGEKPDQMYQVLLDGLRSLSDDLRDYSDRLYEESRKTRVPFPPAYMNLLNAIVTKAAEDYEYALSGDRCESELKEIDQFADILGVRAKNIMQKLRKNQVEFSSFAKRNAKEIIAESEKNRRRGIAMDNNTLRCPNCGGRLYATKDFGSYRICCTKCYFFEVIKQDDK